MKIFIRTLLLTAVVLSPLAIRAQSNDGGSSITEAGSTNEPEREHERLEREKLERLERERLERLEHEKHEREKHEHEKHEREREHEKDKDR